MRRLNFIIIIFFSAVLVAEKLVFKTVLLSTGCCIYPNGWSSREVRDVCGTESNAYKLGACHFSWSMYLLCCSIGILLVCVVLSLKASRVKPHSFRI